MACVSRRDVRCAQCCSMAGLRVCCGGERLATMVGELDGADAPVNGGVTAATM